MSLKNRLGDYENAEDLCNHNPIFVKTTKHCCVRVRGTNLLHHFTSEYDTPWWIADNVEGMEPNFIDMIEYLRECNHVNEWLSGNTEDVIARIPDAAIRDALLESFKQ